jgi:hypothetical protein
MTWELFLAIVALLTSGLAALYARWSASEAKQANDIGRLNALLALRSHYLALMEHQAKLAQTLRGSPGGLQSVQDAVADLDGKLREVGRELDAYHSSLVGAGK